MSRFELRQNISQPVQSVDIINPTHEILTQNQEDNTLIWYDISLSSTDQDTMNTKRALRSVNDYVLLFNDENKCVDYIKSIDMNDIFMVISGTSSTTLLPQIHELKQVKKICIFCMNGDLYKSLLNDYSKVIGIYTEQEQLVTGLKAAILSFVQTPYLISFMKNETTQKTHSNAELDACNFKGQQVFKDIILRMPRTPQSKQKMVDYCRFYYQGNKTVLTKIDEFAERYGLSLDAIHFYTSDSFLHRIINHALRIQDLQLLEIFHFYIIDLSETLTRGFEALKTTWASSRQKTLKLYRGQEISKEEYDRFPSRGYVAFNSFLSTSYNIEVAKMFGGIFDNQNSSDVHFVRVLFHIELDLSSSNSNTVIVADISKKSRFNAECEYLFDFGATFEVINIDHENKIIKMITSDKPHHVSWTRLHESYTCKYASKDIIHEVAYEPSSVNFAESLLRIDKSLKRFDAFEDYILKTSIDDKNYQMASKYCIEGYGLDRIDPNSFYAIECRKLNPDNPYTDEYTNAYNQAIKYWQNFYDYTSGDFIHWPLRALGFSYYRISNYEQAQNFFLKALEMNKSFLNLATCYYFLGRIHGELSTPVESMKYFNQVLQMENSIEPSFIAATYYQMAMLENQNKENDYSLQKKEYLLKALKIYQQINEKLSILKDTDQQRNVELSILKCRSELFDLENWANSSGYIDILDDYFKYCEYHQIKTKSIRQMYEQIGSEAFEYYDYDRALQCYLKSILYFPDNESAHRIIVEIYIRTKKSKLAIEHMKTILKLTDDPRKKVDYLLLMAIEYFEQNNFDIALKYLEECVQVCDQCDSSTKFPDYIFDFELQRKSEIETCKLVINQHCQTTKELYFYAKALTFSLDFIKLFRSEIIFLFESIDLMLESNYTEEIKRMILENKNINETDLNKFLFETLFDNYVIKNNDYDANDLFYCIEALKIYCKQMKIKTNPNRNVEFTCLSKINHILKSNYSYNQLKNHMIELLRTTRVPIDTQEEKNLFEKNYFIELKKNKLAKINLSIGDVYSKKENYDQAKLYYNKSIEYYETFPLLFHLEIADLYSKMGYITVKQHEHETIASSLFEKSIAAMEYKQNTLN